MDNEKVIERLEQLMASGDEQAARKFIIEHFSEFPAQMQQDLAVELFRESMANDLAERQKIAELKKEFVDAIDASEKEQGN